MTAGGIESLGSWRYGNQRYGDGYTPIVYTHTASAMAVKYTIGSLAAKVQSQGLGTWLYGPSRYGEGLGIALYPKTNVLGITYTTSISKYAVPIGVSYTIQRPRTAPMLVYYLVTPPSQFTINGDGSIINPDQVSYVPIPVTARTLLASPILQGLKGITWSYAVLAWADFNRIAIHYNSKSPIVTIGYPDETGTWALRMAVMHPPVYGTMQTMYVYNASFSFSILPG
jgi:hypothetical protein